MGLQGRVCRAARDEGRGVFGCPPALERMPLQQRGTVTHSRSLDIGDFCVLALPSPPPCMPYGAHMPACTTTHAETEASKYYAHGQGARKQYELMSGCSDKKLVVLGRNTGNSTHFGHFDILMGKVRDAVVCAA